MVNVKKLRDYYDNTDQSDAVEGARLESEPVEDLLVSTSIRLSQRTLDEVRALAKSAGVPATTLMREWIEARVAGGSDALVVSVDDLTKFISTSAHRVS